MPLKPFSEYRDEFTRENPFRMLTNVLGLSSVHENNDVEPSRMSKEDAISKQIQEAIEAALTSAETPDSISTAYARMSDHGQISFRKILESELESLLPKKEMPEYGNKVMSMLDVITLGIDSHEKAHRFLRIHDIDLDDPKDFERAKSILTEAIQFYDKHIVSTGNNSIQHVNKFRNPRSIHDIYDIFMTASGYGSHQKLTGQACALLRIAAVIDYIDKDPRLRLLNDIEKQIEKFSSSHIRKYSEKHKSMIFSTRGEPNPIEVPLVGFKTRLKKRDRIIAKLLNKPKATSDELSDPVGMMFITRNSIDIINLLYALFTSESAVFPVANIRPYRSRRRIPYIIDLIKNVKHIMSLPKEQREDETLRLIKDFPFSSEQRPIDSNSRNKFSSSDFKNISITFEMTVMDSQGQRQGVPVEMQLLSEEHMVNNNLNADHAGYEAKQYAQVAKRITGHNLLTSYEEYEQKYYSKKPAEKRNGSY